MVTVSHSSGLEFMKIDSTPSSIAVLASASGWGEGENTANVRQDVLTSLGPWLGYVDVVLQGLLLWQQQNEDDRLNMAALLLTPDELAMAQASPARPSWVRTPLLTPWLDGVQAPPVEGRLAELVERFGLTLFETQVLVLSALPLFDARYELLFAYLQSEEQRKYPGLDLVLTLFSTSVADRLVKRLALCSQQSALLRHGLVSIIDRQGRRSDANEAFYLRLGPGVFHFLVGEPAETWLSGLGDAARWHIPLRGPSLRKGAWAPFAEQLARICFGPHFAASPPRLIHLQGGAGRAALMGELACEARSPMLELDLRLLPVDVPAAERLVQTVLRMVRLYSGVLVLRGWSDVSEELRTLLDGLESCLGRYTRPIICLVTAEDTGDVWQGLPRVSLRLPPRTTQDDLTLVRAGCPPGVTGLDWDWERLLRRMRVDPDHLAQIWREAEGYRQLRGVDMPWCEADLRQALRERGQQHFGALAQRILPRRTFDDLIVDDDLAKALQEILVAVKQRERVLEQGFTHKVGYGTGISALFYGPSGTGKTMAAEVLAGVLGLDLIRVDLSTVVNKYIGETEKNLSKIFDLAELDTGVLLFDEADALFGKRGEVKEAHDRHANIQVSYLLQRLEQYPGLVVLTTNNRGHLDEAFTRRLTFMTRFNAPNAALRERMWRAIWPADIRVSGEVSWSQWATSTDLSGAGIRNAALLASWLAAGEGRVVTGADIERAVQLELGKTGRLML
ncbi:ATP-binding protein [Serratia bockelmannii]